ncbi:MAG: hypothetical protein LBK01_06810, partial [Burkholderiaceae bacterium]|nr:hypothetical protein [Burkholderiaceae bacterium]
MATKLFNAGAANAAGKNANSFFRDALKAQTDMQKARMQGIYYGSGARKNQVKADTDQLGLDVRREVQDKLRNPNLTPEQRGYYQAIYYNPDNPQSVARMENQNMLTQWARNMATNPSAYDVGRTGEIVAAMDGKPRFHNTGNTGVMHNVHTGESFTSHPGLYALFGKEAMSRMQENRAQAGLAGARTRKVGREAAQGAKGRLVTDKDGARYLVNPATGESVPVTIDGRPIVAPSKGRGDIGERLRQIEEAKGQNGKPGNARASAPVDMNAAQIIKN